MGSYCSNDEGWALDGYDPVAYFSGAAKKGRKQHAVEWRGVRWKFASGDNLETFRAKPERYAPQFGGYCAFGMSFDKLARANPEVFLIEDGKLYLSASPLVRRFWKWFGDVRKSERYWQGKSQ